jgi:hypothetical protein
MTAPRISRNELKKSLESSEALDQLLGVSSRPAAPTVASRPSTPPAARNSVAASKNDNRQERPPVLPAAEAGPAAAEPLAPATTEIVSGATPGPPPDDTAIQAVEGEIIAPGRSIDAHGHLSDLRVAALAAVPPLPPDETTISRLEDVLGGTTLLRDAATANYVRTLVRDVHAKWRTVGLNYLEIGRMLLDAQRRLEDGYTLLEESEKVLPFSRSVASKLRKVARAVEEELLPQDHLPPYTIAYLLASMPRDQLEQAKKADLIRADVKQRDIVRFTQRFQRQKTAAVQSMITQGTPLAMHQLDALETERAALRRRRVFHMQRVEQIDRRLSEIGNLLDASDPQ